MLLILSRMTHSVAMGVKQQGYLLIQFQASLCPPFSTSRSSPDSNANCCLDTSGFNVPSNLDRPFTTPSEFIETSTLDRPSISTSEFNEAANFDHPITAAPGFNVPSSLGRRIIATSRFNGISDLNRLISYFYLTT